MHDVQTESSTPTDSAEYLKVCHRIYKHKDQPLFVLLAQDITAPVVIDFWVKVQQKVREYMKQGLPMEQAVKSVRSYYFLEPHVPADDTKLAGACAIAGAMEQWPDRKLAD